MNASMTAELAFHLVRIATVDGLVESLLAA